MVIVYATTRYVSRYFPALDSILTFPVVYHYSAADYRDHFNMSSDSSSSSYSNDSTDSSDSITTSRIIIQRRPSVIQVVPRQEKTEDTCDEKVDVVGDGVKMEEEEGLKTKTKRSSSTTEVESRKSGKRKRMEIVEKNESCQKDGDWKPLENKRHKCSECGMRFKKPSALVIHLRTHSGEKPYHCEHCHKRFSISGNLRRHMFTHTGEKPYKCRACGRAFNNPSHLARHSKKIHI